MRKNVPFRRYLAEFDSQDMPHLFTDILVIGSGIAGLRAAVEAAKKCSVLLICKDDIDEGNTKYAQGGIAVAMAPGDTVDLHIADTLAAGQGLCDEAVVGEVIRDGPARIRELIEWGTRFDRAGGGLAYTREGGHSRRRVIHARGDTTGQEVERALVSVVRSSERIKVFEHTFAMDLLVLDGHCRGCVVWQESRGLSLVWAKSVILATGGCGEVYRETTNPEITTGDGLAMAYRGGAVLRDMEFVQFHPTTLYIAGAARALITEAVRGEGAVLLNKQGDRFMPDYHPDAELAPRDVVSRSIREEIAKVGGTCVYLDLRHLPADRVRKRFPMIRDLCASFDIDISKDVIPVRPSAHYMIGGVRADAHGRTSIGSLFACGEVACTGLHGANRLGSNSLLEGLVFGQCAGRAAGEAAREQENHVVPGRIQTPVVPQRSWALDLEDVENSLRSLMWRNVGVERREPALGEAAEMIDFWCSYVLDKTFATSAGWELQNMLTVSRLIVEAAQRRRESRGVHYRLDHTEKDDVAWAKHIDIRWDEEQGVVVT